MNNLLLSNILDVTTIFVCLFTTVRVGMVYPYVRSPRLLTLGISMGILTIVAIADLIDSNLITIATGSDWFIYSGQIAAFLCILLSITSTSDAYLSGLIRFQVFACVILLCLLLSTFALPDVTDQRLHTLLGSPRFLLCAGISFYYLVGFIKKQTRFSLLMSASFLLLVVGYLLDVQQHIVPLYAELLDALGDVSRLLGFLSLLAAVLGN